MAERKEPLSDEEFVKRVSELFGEIGPESADELDETLRALGLAPDDIGTRGKHAADSAMANSPFNWRQRASRELEEARRRLSAVSPPASLNRATTTAAILDLTSRLGQAGRRATTHYRNLDVASDQDLADLLAELQELAAVNPPQFSEDSS